MLNRFDYLTTIDEVFSHYLATESVQGEEWHDLYKKYPYLFRKVVRSDTETDRLLYSVFKKFAERAYEFINWTVVDLRRADEEKIELVLDSPIWGEFEDEILQALIEGLSIALQAGGEFAELETKIATGWSWSSSPAIDYLRKTNLELVKNLSKTTRSRINSVLRTGLTLGENREQMIDRVFNVLNDRKRASAIAHTETIRAYGEGRLEVAQQIEEQFDVVVMKTWRDGQPKACKICAGLNGESVRYNKTFSNGLISIPAHPNCRCNMSLDVVVDEEDKPKHGKLVPTKDFFEYVAAETGGRWVTLKDGRRILIRPPKGARSYARLPTPIQGAVNRWAQKGDDQQLSEMIKFPSPEFKNAVKTHQLELKQEFGNKIRLYRGEGTESTFRNVDEYNQFLDTVMERGFLSWTTDKSVAEHFAAKIDKGVLVARDVPVENILFSHYQGWGHARGEEEFIVKVI